MFVILFEVLTSMVGSAFAAGTLAWLSWTLLSRTRFPGLGPIFAFVMLAVLRNAGDFTETLLIFSGILAVAAFATFFDAVSEMQQHGKPSTRHRPF